jgi:membrane protein DedA with SNARE-associated domain
MPIEQIITSYGAIGVFVGTFFEGEAIVILAIRYVYGLRAVLCFAIGMSRISSWKFIVLNAIGVAIWAMLTSLGGYYVGRTMAVILADAKKYELAAAGLIIAAGWSVWAVRRFRQRRR